MDQVLATEPVEGLVTMVVMVTMVTVATHRECLRFRCFIVRALIKGGLNVKECCYISTFSVSAG